MKIQIVAITSFGIMITGCAASMQPMTQTEIRQGVFWSQMAYTCVQKGYVSDLSAMAMYKNSVDRNLASRASAEQITTANNANFRAYDWSAVSIQECRTLELTTVGAANEEASRQRQSDRLRASVNNTVQPYRPNYASCLTTAGMTSCVAY